MNDISGRKRQRSLIKQLKRRLLVVVGLLVLVLIFCFPVSIINATIQRTLDEQQIALQQDQSDLLNSMLNQASALRRYVTSNDTTVLQSLTSSRQSRLDWNSRIALIIAFLLSASAMILLWRILTRLIKALTTQLIVLKTATNQLGSGDLAARVQELGYLELNDLGQTFNTMAEDLASHSGEVERTNSELRDRRDELTSANTALKEANRVRSEFLSTMSHELRTPLASIIGFSQMLLDDAGETGWNQQQQNDLKRILKNGQHLLGLSNDVLDLSKIEAGVLVKAALQNTPFTVVGVQAPLQVMKLVQEMQPCAIILDVMMPQLNGWQILHQLKANPAISSIPVVMLTVIEDQTTGYVLEADDYLIKPFQRDVLLDALRRFISAQEGSTQANRLEAQPV